MAKQHDIQRCATKLTVDYNEHGDVMKTTLRTSSQDGILRHKKTPDGNEWEFEFLTHRDTKKR